MNIMGICLPMRHVETDTDTEGKDVPLRRGTDLYTGLSQDKGIIQGKRGQSVADRALTQRELNAGYPIGQNWLLARLMSIRETCSLR